MWRWHWCPWTVQFLAPLIVENKKHKTTRLVSVQMFLLRLGPLLAPSRLCLQFINAALWSGNLSWWLPLWLSSLSLCSPRRPASAALTPERRGAGLVTLSKGKQWVEGSTQRHISSGTGALASRREEDKMSGLVVGDNRRRCHGDRCGVRLQRMTAALTVAQNVKTPEVGVQESRLDLITINLLAFFLFFWRSDTKPADNWDLSRRHCDLYLFCNHDPSCSASH